jgi:hypothetical protein
MLGWGHELDGGLGSSMTRLQRVIVGKQVLYATAMILMKDRDGTLDALSKGVTMKAMIEVINFTAEGSRRKTLKHVAALEKEGFELLAVVLPDRHCEYSLGNPQHLALAEELVSRIEKEALQRMKISGPVQ